MPTISVLVPSYRRPDDLRRCLEALCTQQLGPAQVIVVARDVDESTHRVAQAFADRLPLEIVKVSEPGQVHALNAGLLRVKAEIVAITDDDAAPRPDWIAHIAAHFQADPQIGGVGGRDWYYTPTGMVIVGQRRVVGRIQWYGRIVGNHHLGDGPAREVHILKGANMSFRRVAIEGLSFNTGLRGHGAQVYNDMSFSLSVRNRGWKLIYNPVVAVDHYLAPRFDVDGREMFNADAVENSAFNLIWVIQTQLTGWRRFAARQWQTWIGMGWKEPVLLRALLARTKGDAQLCARARAAHLGRKASLDALKRKQP